MPSSSPSKGMTTPTGPKISSWATLIELDTSANRVGSKKNPFDTSAGRAPPHARRAPSDVPAATYRSTRSRCASRMRPHHRLLVSGVADGHLAESGLHAVDHLVI